MYYVDSNSSVIGLIGAFISNPNNAVIGFIGTLVGGLLSYLGSKNAYKYQLKLEHKNIAKAIDIDLNTIFESPNFKFYYNAYNNDMVNGTKIDTSQYVIMPDKLYDEKTGLYFVFNHDITKFEYELSSDTYEFYNDLFTAEFYRKYIDQNYHEYREQYKNADDSGIVTTVNTRYGLMRNLIIKCGDKIPELREKLEKVQNQ